MQKSLGRLFKIGEMMGDLFLWLIALLCLSLPTWLLYHAWRKSRLLSERLAQCDNTLLTDSSVKVTQIVSAPTGTIVTENARLVVAPISSEQIP